MTTAQPFDRNAFHDFEQAGWERVAHFYGDAFGPLTAQTASALLDAARTAQGTRLLDVASGPGFIAVAAAERGATVTGLDFAPAMVAEARRRYPAIAFREGDAQALDVQDGGLDAVVMNFAMLHLARPDAAIAEAHRALRPGGRYAFTVWAGPDKAVAFGIALRAIERLGSAKVELPEGPPFFRFSDVDATRATLEAAGFTDVDVRELPLVWQVSTADDVFEALARGGVRTAAILRAQSPEVLAAIREAVTRDVETYTSGNGYALPMTAVLASGTKGS